MCQVHRYGPSSRASSDSGWGNKAQMCKPKEEATHLVGEILKWLNHQRPWKYQAILWSSKNRGLNSGDRLWTFLFSP